MGEAPVRFAGMTSTLSFETDGEAFPEEVQGGAMELMEGAEIYRVSHSTNAIGR